LRDSQAATRCRGMPSSTCPAHVGAHRCQSAERATSKNRGFKTGGLRRMPTFEKLPEATVCSQRRPPRSGPRLAQAPQAVNDMPHAGEGRAAAARSTSVSAGGCPRAWAVAARRADGRQCVQARAPSGHTQWPCPSSQAGRPQSTPEARSRALKASPSEEFPPRGIVKVPLLALARYQNPRMLWYGFDETFASQRGQRTFRDAFHALSPRPKPL